MKSTVKRVSTKPQQIESFLLIVLFLFISTTQLFHIHNEGYSNQNAACEDEEQIQVLNKCSICDYYLHTQGQQILLFYPTLQTIVNPELITLNTRVLTGNYEFTLQVIANKGPPNFF